MDASILVLVIAGIALVIGSFVFLTTFGEKRPFVALVAILSCVLVYLAIILYRIGLIDFQQAAS